VAAQGITLLELLVVIALISILSALVYPSFGNALSNLRLRGEARRLVSACRLAKWEAIAKRRPYRVVADLQKNQFMVADASEQVTKELDLSPGIRIFQAQKISENGPADANEFYFFPNGTAETGSITLRDDRGRNVRIAIDFLTGDAKIVEFE
jgi:type II secretion system protein H